MTKLAVNTILFVGIGTMIALQFDAVEGHLVDGYAGLRWTMYASFIGAAGNFAALVRKVRSCTS